MKYIDLENIIKNSDSEFLKKFPSFVIKLLAKIIRQKEVNEIIDKYSEYYGTDFLKKVFEEFNLKVSAEGLENLPEKGKCFFVSNHPFGFIDGLVMTNIVINKYGRLKAIGNDVYNMIPNLEPVIAVVNVFGKNPRDYFIALDEIYKSDIPMTNFPSGEVSRVYKGKIQDCEWQKSFITKTVSCNRSIVPMFFFGRNSILFYAFGVLRKFFGIKLNLELVLLPNELFRKKNKTIRVKIGKPIPPETFDRSKSNHEWAQWVREQVYAMKKG